MRDSKGQTISVLQMLEVLVRSSVHSYGTVKIVSKDGNVSEQ